MKSLKPAWGRDYKNTKAVYADLNAGKEFQLTGCLDGGGYVTANELMDAGETKVLVRYNKLKTQGVFGLSRTAALQEEADAALDGCNALELDDAALPAARGRLSKALDRLADEEAK